MSLKINGIEINLKNKEAIGKQIKEVVRKYEKTI